VFRRSLTLLATLMLAFVVAAAASAALVRIRVEGKTRTIFGAAEPRALASNPLEALEAASRAGEFYAHVQQTSLGPYIDQIGLYAAAGATGWVFKVNGVSPPVGADKVELKDGDVVLWYWATFGDAGGPPTLVLERTADRCYTVSKQDDTGAKTAATGAVLHVDGRSIPTTVARTCPGPHRGLVKATAPGAVRSNALP
jgi:Domain of unknown function (DUF4430)